MRQLQEGEVTVYGYTKDHSDPMIDYYAPGTAPLAGQVYPRGQKDVNQPGDASQQSPTGDGQRPYQGDSCSVSATRWRSAAEIRFVGGLITMV